MIPALATHHPLRRVCQLLDVSPSGYYQWRHRLPGPRAKANDLLFQHLKGPLNKAVKLTAARA